MTPGDVAVQLGALMAAAGGILAAWGLLSGQVHARRRGSRRRTS